jgi:hypothetical protein
MTESEPSEGQHLDPRAPEPEEDSRWSLRHPKVRHGLALIGLGSLAASVWTSFVSRDPWGLLIVAVICAFLAFPRSIGELIESIKLPGGSELRFRRATAAPTAPGAPAVAALANETPKSLGDRRLHLAKLRTAGVELRNRGIELSAAALAGWLSEVTNWSETVAKAIEGVNSADAEWFRTLDAVPPPRIGFRPLSRQHAKAYRELDFMLEKLDTLIIRYAAFDPPKNEPPPSEEEHG